MLGRTRLSAGWAVAAIVLAGASPVLAETTYATGSGSQNGAFVALHRSEWIRGLNPPASSRHLAT